MAWSSFGHLENTGLDNTVGLESCLILQKLVVHIVKYALLHTFPYIEVLSLTFCDSFEMVANLSLGQTQETMQPIYLLPARCSA